jgi:phage-related protein
MPSIGRRCHDLLIQHEDVTWRIVYRIDADAIVIADVLMKKTQTTPKHVIEACQQRLRQYDTLGRG